MGADDRVDVAVEHRQSLGVPVQPEPVAAIRRRPPSFLRGPWAEAGFDLGEPSTVGGHALLAERRCVGDRVDLEVVALVVELERQHPVDQFRDRRRGPRRDLGMQVQQLSARVSDDPAGVVGSHDYLQRRGDRLLRHRKHDGWIVGLGCLLQNRHRLVHLTAMRVGGAPARQVRTSTDQRQDGLGKMAHAVNDFTGAVLDRGPLGSAYRTRSAGSAKTGSEGGELGRDGRGSAAGRAPQSVGSGSADAPRDREAA